MNSFAILNSLFFSNLQVNNKTTMLAYTRDFLATSSSFLDLLSLLFSLLFTFPRNIYTHSTPYIMIFFLYQNTFISIPKSMWCDNLALLLTGFHICTHIFSCYRLITSLLCVLLSLSIVSDFMTRLLLYDILYSPIPTAAFSFTRFSLLLLYRFTDTHSNTHSRSTT